MSIKAVTVSEAKQAQEGQGGAKNGSGSGSGCSHGRLSDELALQEPLKAPHNLEKAACGSATESGFARCPRALSDVGLGPPPSHCQLCVTYGSLALRGLGRSLLPQSTYRRMPNSSSFVQSLGQRALCVLRVL